MPYDPIDKKANIEKYWRKNPKSISKYQFVHHFLPKAEEKERSVFLSNVSLIFYSLFVVIVIAIFKILPSIAPGVLGYASNIVVDDLLLHTNKMRQESGVSELVINDKLSEAAYRKAKHMFENNYWAHISPDGTEPWDFILGSGYDYVYAGENLAKNFSDSDHVVEAWMKSPTHKENLLSGNYDEIGFAVVNGVLDGYETTLVVQIFGRPQDRSALLASKSSNTMPIAEEQVPVEVPVVEEVVATEREQQLQVVYPSNVQNRPVLDVSVASRTVSLIIAGFVGLLLLIDVIYSRRRGIVKFNGQTFAHLALFFVAILSIWFVLSPGAIM